MIFLIIIKSSVLPATNLWFVTKTIDLPISSPPLSFSTNILKKYLNVFYFLNERIKRKIQEDARRGADISRKKESIIRSRKQMAIQARIQRDQIIDSMERIRRTKQWNKASSIVASTTMSSSLDSSGKKKSRKKKKKKTATQHTLRPSASAPGLSQTVGVDSMPTPNPRGARNQDEDLRLSRRADNKGKIDRPRPMPYVSPYERQQSIDENVGTAGKMLPAFAHVEAKTGLVTF